MYACLASSLHVQTFFGHNFPFISHLFHACHVPAHLILLVMNIEI
jgi:hypothetical protein